MRRVRWLRLSLPPLILQYPSADEGNHHRPLAIPARDRRAAGLQENLRIGHQASRYKMYTFQPSESPRPHRFFYTRIANCTSGWSFNHFCRINIAVPALHLTNPPNQDYLVPYNTALLLYSKAVPLLIN